MEIDDDDLLYDNSDDESEMLLDTASDEMLDNQHLSEPASQATNALSILAPVDTLQNPIEPIAFQHAISIVPLVYTPTVAGENAISKIENIFANITDALLNETGEMSIVLKKRLSQLHNTVVQEEDSKLIIRFPGRTAQEAWRFTVIIRILELVHNALTDGKVITKRDIYYQDPALFKKQEVVDRYVNNIAYTFQVPRSSLNVVAAVKGLVTGPFTVSRGGVLILDGTHSNQEGLLIPELKRGDIVDLKSTRWIILIEKEANFHALVSSPTWCSLSRDGILLTGKGYPDIATRALLRRFSEASRTDHALPIFALVDFDPDGLGILSTFKHGSLNLTHENEALVVPSIQWIGLRSVDISSVVDISLESSQRKVDVDETRRNQGLLQLSSRDRKKAVHMMRWKCIAGEEPETEWRRELQVMLMLNLKAEIQLLDSMEGGLESWLLRKIASF